MDVDAISPALLAWYDTQARALPWRSPPGLPPPAPYRVWLSEIMLQQTGTLVVARYFKRFVELWPTVAALAAADDADVLREWAGLGYYARARNLIACARIVAARGGFPDSEAELRRLPGVGAYTAAAVAAIAFGARAVVVDGNVERVVARMFAVDAPLPGAKAKLYACAAAVTPEARSGDHAQAMMDLGATICTPRTPACPDCPLIRACIGHASGDPARFPVKAPRPAKPVRHGNAYWLEVGGKVLLLRRPPSGLLGGMLALPGDAWDDTAAPPIAGDWRPVGIVRHVFTHFDLRLRVHALRVDARPGLAGEWVAVRDVAAAGLPTLYAKAALAVAQFHRHGDGSEMTGTP